MLLNMYLLGVWGFELNFNQWIRLNKCICLNGLTYLNTDKNVTNPKT